MEIVGQVAGEADMPNGLMDAPLPQAPFVEAIQQANNQMRNNIRKTFLLTFAQDGYELAKQVAQQIRNLNLGLGVLILEENEDELEFNSESIYRWYQEVGNLIEPHGNILCLINFFFTILHAGGLCNTNYYRRVPVANCS